MGDVQVSLLSGLLSTVLPNMRSQNFSTSSENNVGSSVVGSELASSVAVDLHSHFSAFELVNLTWDFFVEDVEHYLAYFLSILEFELNVKTLDSYESFIVLLASRCRVDCTLAQD